MNGSSLKGQRESKDVRVLSHEFFLCVFQCFFKAFSYLQPHPSCIAGILCADDVDGAGIHLRNVPAGHHGKAVEGMEGVGKTVFPDVFRIRSVILSQTVHIRQNIHRIMLKIFIQRPQIRPSGIIKITVAERRAKNHTPVAHDPLESKHLRRERLHHHDGIGTHPVSVMELLRHTEYQHVVLLFCPVDVGSLVRRLPADRHHFFGITGKNRNLSGEGVQHRITAKEGMSHPVFHVHADFIEFIAHERAAVDRCEIFPVHDRRHMVAGNGAPVGDAGRRMLVPSGVPAVRVSLHVPHQNRNVAVKHIPVEEDGIAPPCGSEIYHVLRILGIMADDLSRWPEFLKKLLSEDGKRLLLRAPGVESVADDKEHVPLLNPRRNQFLQHIFHGKLPVAGLLLSPLDPVRNNKDHGLLLCRLPVLFYQLRQRLHPDRVGQALLICFFQLLFRNALRILHRLSGDENIRTVRQHRLHHTGAIFKCKLFHFSSVLLFTNVRSRSNTGARFPDTPPDKSRSLR